MTMHGIGTGWENEKNMKKEIIVWNKARCKKCGDVIESLHQHDFKWCRCQAIAVDGGNSYLKRTGKIEDCEELSEVYESQEDFLNACRQKDEKEKKKIQKHKDDMNDFKDPTSQLEL